MKKKVENTNAKGATETPFITCSQLFNYMVIHPRKRISDINCGSLRIYKSFAWIEGLEDTTDICRLQGTNLPTGHALVKKLQHQRVQVNFEKN